MNIISPLFLFFVICLSLIGIYHFGRSAMTTNRAILVDNATLSGVERLLGHSQIVNMNYIDNDILCFEKLVTAILFSDKLISVDDYKESYRSERLKRFNFIDFLNIDQNSYRLLSVEAANFAKSMIFSFDGSKPAGDVVSFFEALRIDPQLRWDVFVSSEYLTMSLLVKNTRETRYETAIDSVFRNESANANAVQAGANASTSIAILDRPEISDIKELVRSFQSNNASFSGLSSRSLLERCVFGYGWSAERSHFYNSVAAQHDSDAFLAPLRDAFCESCCRLESKSQVNSLLGNLKEKTQETLAMILEPSGRARFALKLPFFTAHLISLTDSPKQGLELALKMRDQSDFRNSRAIFHNLSHLAGNSRYTEVNQIMRLLEQSCTSLLKKYAASPPNGPQFSLSLGVSGPSVSTSFKLDRLFSAYRNRHITRIFRNIAQDMLNVEKLGSLHDKMCLSIKKHKDANHPKISATPKYMENKSSAYGRPAEI